MLAGGATKGTPQFQYKYVRTNIQNENGKLCYICLHGPLIYLDVRCLNIYIYWMCTLGLYHRHKDIIPECAPLVSSLLEYSGILLHITPVLYTWSSCPFRKLHVLLIYYAYL